MNETRQKGNRHMPAFTVHFCTIALEAGACGSLTAAWFRLLDVMSE